MKNNLRSLIVCMSFFLVLTVCHTVLAEEKPAQAKDASKKMNVSGYDETARGVNTPMYNYYAKVIKEKTGITKGVCLDVGSGGGYMGLALAKITDLDFIFLDISAEMLEKAKLHIVEDGLQKRAKTLLADVHNIPLPDGSINLVISRGSIPFWKDPAKALKEIYRVLAPGGKAYVGGGRGTPEVKAQIGARIKERNPAWHDRSKKNGDHRKECEESLKNAGITNCSVIIGKEGSWIEMNKLYQKNNLEVAVNE